MACNDERISRRSFFRAGLRKSSEKIVGGLSRKIEAKFPRKALRPPGAVVESLFLLNCVKSGDCAEACPHGAIQIMTEGTGAYKDTPFIDVFQQACEFCKDFPCIEACNSSALLSVESAPVPAIGLAKINMDHCLVKQGQYCDYCFNSCPPGVDAIRKSAENLPEIDEKACIGCGKCAFICVSQTGKAIEVIPLNSASENGAGDRVHSDGVGEDA